MERLAESPKSRCGFVFVMDSDRLESLSGGALVGIIGELPGMFIMVGESVSGWCCGALYVGSRAELRAVEDVEGRGRWLILRL
jgi:hypothetical protein